MAINESVKDLENNPTKTKTVTLDLQSVIPLDNEGDEAYILSATPGAGVTKTGGGTFNPIFIREFKAGYLRSSGKKNPPFIISSGAKNLQISIDSSPLRSISLNEGSGLSGDDVAADMQTQITALAGIGQDEAGNLAFLNATVKFKNNRFLIVAGSISNTYTGVGQSSVEIAAGLTNDASVVLGFNIPVSSSELSSKQSTETVLTSGYVSGGSVTVASTDGLAAGEAFSITDGTNREYFVASGTTSTTIGISGSGLVNAYASGSVVQKIFERDPDGSLASPYETIDEIMRFGLRSIANQIDFTV